MKYLRFIILIAKKIYFLPKTDAIKAEIHYLDLQVFDKTTNIPEISVSNSSDEEKVVKTALEHQTILISFTNDMIIPLENIIAKLQGINTEILVKVTTAQNAKDALGALEIGAHGIVLETDDLNELFATTKLLMREDSIKLVKAKVVNIEHLGIGARVCVDTVDIMNEGQGMLVGSSSQGMLLIQAEIAKNAFVATRPFRVNAGAVSLYILTPGNKTKYLQELSAGSRVLITDRFGNAQTSFVARAKIEMRPLILIEASYEQQVIKAILQLAETVRLVQEKTSIPVTDLKVGDEILARIEAGGRHFGMLVEKESIIEK